MVGEEEHRRHVRIKETADIKWAIEGREESGEALVRDISISGVLLEVKRPFVPDKQAIYLFESLDENYAIPKKARLAWSHPMKTDPGYSLSGFEFIQPPKSIVDRIKGRIEDWFNHLSQTGDVHILSKYLTGRQKRY